MSVVEALKAVICHELEERRAELERDPATLQSVGVVVKLDGQGVPRLVIWRPEYQRDFRRAAKSAGL